MKNAKNNTVTAFAGRDLSTDHGSSTTSVIAIIPATFDDVDPAEWQAVANAALTNKMALIIDTKRYKTHEDILKLGINLYCLKVSGCKVLGYLSLESGNLKPDEAIKHSEIASKNSYIDGFFLDHIESQEHTDEISFHLKKHLPTRKLFLASHAPGCKDYLNDFYSSIADHAI